MRAATLACLALLASCAIDLKSMAPFPCGADETCPDGFRCVSGDGGRVCIVSSDSSACSNDSDCSQGFWCQSSKCTACNDAEHCGTSCQACTNALPVCSGTACVQCVLDADCNAAGATCSAQHTCQCPTGQLYCTDSCADVSTSAANCGGCGNVCSAGQGCSGGNCVKACTTSADCLIADEDCTAGACTCSGTICGSTCVDTTSSHDQCGDCSTVCRADQICSASTCICGAGMMVCDASCASCSGNQVPTCLSDGSFYCCDQGTIYCEAYPGVCWDSSQSCDSLIKCPDGNWRSCPESTQRYNCNTSQCADCTAACDGKWCGDDGCGGNCGQCPPGQTCTDPPGSCS
jgi:hypothetical protein